MKHATVWLGLVASATLALPALAQTEPTQAARAPSPEASQRKATVPSAAPEPAPDHAEASKTWYVMLAIYEPYDPERCKKPVYKVSTYDPIIFDGPSAISQAHANAVVGAWLGYLRDRSPTAYKWINGPTGNHVNEIYFRESEEEARQAFASDGHMKRDTNCTGSVLYRQGTSKFRFVPSDAFKRADFGAEPRPTEPTAAPAKEIAAARAEP